jgi:hypothetical protein
MSKCTNCGRATNGATSNYWSSKEIDCETPKEFGIATQCYAAFVNGKWVKGCVYNDIGPMKKMVLAKLLRNEGL